MLPTVRSLLPLATLFLIALVSSPVASKSLDHTALENSSTTATSDPEDLKLSLHVASNEQAKIASFPQTLIPKLSTDFYVKSCPEVEYIVMEILEKSISKEPRMAASLLRLHFHDCFVQGCDGSVLLDDTMDFTGEKSVKPNANSLRGFEVVDKIKSDVEAQCPATVSCADILALAAHYGVTLLGGPSWGVPLGRRDARTADKNAANRDLPTPFSPLPTIISLFAAKGLSARQMTALSGAHTIGQAQCSTFRARIYNDTNIDTSFAITRRADCPRLGGGTKSVDLDVETPAFFDSSYYSNLIAQRGLLHSDQELYKNGSQDRLVAAYSKDKALFFKDFSEAMIAMGKITPLTGTAGEIRHNCRIIN